MDTQNRRFWTKAETQALLAAYRQRKNEFSMMKHSIVYDNILEDLICQNVLLKPTTADMLRGKIKNLLRSYRAACDMHNSGTVNLNRNGPVSADCEFMDELEDIFGDRPTSSDDTTISMGASKPVEVMTLKEVLLKRKIEANKQKEDLRHKRKLEYLRFKRETQLEIIEKIQKAKLERLRFKCENKR